MAIKLTYLFLLQTQRMDCGANELGRKLRVEQVNYDSSH